MSNNLYRPRAFNLKRLAVLLGQPRGDLELNVAFMTKWFQKYTTLQPVVDTFGNFHLQVGTHGGTLFTAHTDTVDSPKLTDRKLMVYDANRCELMLHHDTPEGAVLGADDGAGCEVLVCMAEAGVPGYYLWTAAEEHGCLGTKALLEENRGFFEQFDRCVSFDRKGTNDIIVNQQGTECCSAEFLGSLKMYLQSHVPAYGTFTDSAALMGVIPECTNISVGYSSAHTREETLHLGYLDSLIEKALVLPWHTLKTRRTPEEPWTYTPKRWSHDDDRDQWDVYDICTEDPEYVMDFLRDLGLTKVFLNGYYEETTNGKAKESSTISDIYEGRDDYREYQSYLSKW
jgi:hypothetical protein